MYNVAVYYNDVRDETLTCRVEVYSDHISWRAGNVTFNYVKGRCSSAGMIHPTSNNKAIPLCVLHLANEPKRLFKGTNAGRQLMLQI